MRTPDRHWHEAYAPVHCCGIDGNALIDNETMEPLELHCPLCGEIYRYANEEEQARREHYGEDI